MFELGDFTEVNLDLLNYQNIESLLEVKPAVKQVNYWGNIDLISRNKISVVGSRRISHYGKKVVDYYVAEFVKQGVVTVSGGMYGVDLEVHLKTLEKEGDTIIVLGYGSDYLSSQKYLNILKDKITKKNTLIISEYKNNQPPERWTFPKRNRIVAAISNQLLIIEAAKGSGSLITADIAMDLGKDVYVVPGDIFGLQNSGKHNLIKQGAYLTDSPMDILSHMVISAGKNSTNIIQTSVNLPEKEYNIYCKIKEGKNTVDELVLCTQLSLNEVILAISNLEIEQFIQTNLLGEISLVNK